MRGRKLCQLSGKIIDLRLLRYKVQIALRTQFLKKFLINVFEACLGELKNILTEKGPRNI